MSRPEIALARKTPLDTARNTRLKRLVDSVVRGYFILQQAPHRD